MGIRRAKEFEETEQKMRKTAAAMIVLGSLTACGGDDSASTTDRPPTIALKLPSEAEGGSIIPIDVAVTDDKDANLSFSLACNRGTLDGTILTLPEVTTDTTVECTASATDSGGNTTTVSGTLTIKPSTVALIPYGNPEQQTIAGGVGIVFAENITLDEEQYTGTFRGKSVPLIRNNGNELFYVLPVDTPVGTDDLVIQIGSRVFRVPITVAAPVIVADSRAQVAQVLGRARTVVANYLADPATTAAIRTQLETALPQLETAISNLPNASDAEVSEFASRLAALGLIARNNTQTTYRSLLTGAASTSMKGLVNISGNQASFFPFRAQVGETCSEDATKFAETMVHAVLGAALLGVAFESLLPAAIVPGAGALAIVGAGVAVGIGSVLFVDNLFALKPALRAFKRSCWTEADISLSSFDDFDSAQRQMLTKWATPITLPGKQTFRQDSERTFKLQRSFSVTPSLLKRAIKYASDIEAILTLDSLMPSDVADLLRSFRVSGSEAVPAGRISLSAISSGLVSGSARANGEVLGLTFRTTAKAQDLTEGKLPFTFNLLRVEEDTVRVEAEMSLSLPKAFDAAVEVVQGEATSSVVQTEGADTLIVTRSPTNGSLSLSNSGEFTYRPGGTFFGRDQFKYIARNSDGDSEEATVIIDVVRRFEGTWNIKVDTRTTSESSPGFCPNEFSEFSTSVAKVSDTEYTTTYEGFSLTLTMSSKDDVSGLRGSRTYRVENGAEVEQGTVSIRIPDSKTLNGSASFTYTDPTGTCSGQSTITGTR